MPSDAEQERQGAADEQADDDVGVVELERDRVDELREVVLQILGIGREQHQRRKRRRTDGIALGHRLGGVADRVEGVGHLAHFRRQARPFRRCHRHCR